jgi:hypothetical protein
MRTGVLGSLTLLIGLALAGPVAAQQFPTFGGGELRAGIVWPDRAGSALAVSLDVDLGRFLPLIRTFAGVHGFSPGVDRMVLDQRVTGDLSVRGGRAGMRLEPLGALRFAPYLAGALLVMVETQLDALLH